MSKQTMNVVFAGTPDFAAAALNAIVDAGFHVPLVLTQPDRPKGRGLQLQASPVKQVALQRGLTVAQPEKLRGNDEALALLNSVEADVMVVAAYGLILPEAVLNSPKYGCLNIHASLLPRWRGAAPIQRAIEAGDREKGVCIMQMDAGLDTGNIVSTHRYAIANTDTAIEVHDALMALGARAIVADLNRLCEQGVLLSCPQPELGVTYAAKLSKDEARIQWQQSAEALQRHIRAFNPTPTAWTTWQQQTVKIWSATVVEGTHSAPAGSILSADAEGIVVACGEQALQIHELQVAGSKRMSVQAFLAGRTMNIGDCLV